MKKVKVFFVLAIIVLATLLCCSMSAFALTDGEWEFQLLDNEVAITGYLGEGGDVVIPETIYGCPVTAVGEPAGMFDAGIFEGKATSITYPSTVKVIYGESTQTKPGDGYTTSDVLKKVVIPEGVEEIGKNAFKGCIGLTEITIPSTVKIIDEDAFYDCKSLKKVTFAGNPQVTEIRFDAFSYCESLTDFSMPETVTTLGYKAFKKSGVVNIKLTSVTKMEDSVFEECPNLKTVTISPGLTQISQNAFRNCKALESVDLPNTITLIRNYAFAGCESLKSIILPSSLKQMYEKVFSGCSGLVEVVIPYGTERVNWNVFENCPNLKSLYMPSTVTSMDKDILKGSNNCIIFCMKGSKAEELCKQYGISYLTDNSVNSGITVLYNGSRISFHSYAQNPQIMEGRTLVPLRSIFEAMGADVQWDGNTNTAIATRKGVEVKIQIGAKEILKNGNSIPVDVPAQLLNDRTMVPARVIAEAFGADVQWNGNGQTVLITE